MRGKMGATALVPDSNACTGSTEGVIIEAYIQTQLSLVDPLREQNSSKWVVNSGRALTKPLDFLKMNISFYGDHFEASMFSNPQNRRPG